MRTKRKIPDHELARMQQKACANEQGATLPLRYRTDHAWRCLCDLKLRFYRLFLLTKHAGRSGAAYNRLERVTRARKGCWGVSCHSRVSSPFTRPRAPFDS